MHEVWRRLVAFQHRGSGTRLEREAARWLAGYLETLGFNPKVQSFRTPTSWGPEVLAVSLALGFGGLFGWVPLAALGFYGFWAYFSGWPRPWQGLFARATSQNVLAEAGDGPRTLLLMAHYDTAKTYFVYDPRRVGGFRANFVANAVMAGAAAPAALLGGWPSWLLGGYFLLQAALLAWRELTAPFVNGANDNASGAAVASQLFLDLAKEPPPGWRIKLALTGAEEVGAVGAAELLRSGWVSGDDLVLNIDNVGRGELFYACGEGMLGFVRYRGPLLEAAGQLKEARPLAYRLAYFDTWPLARRGVAVLTLIRLAGGLPPNWHWPSDRPENVSWEKVEETYVFSMRLIDSIFYE